MLNVRVVAGMLVGLIAAGVMGCGGRAVSGESPDRGPAPMRQEAPRKGMSTRNKVLLLAGAAALYYMYQKHKNRQGTGAEGKYYRSKNGRVYFRRSDGSYQWVDPPTQPIQVPEEDYRRYTGRSAEGYDGRVLREAPAGW